LETERRGLLAQIADLKMSLDINKGIICDLLQSSAKGQFTKGFETAVMQKCSEETQLLRQRIDHLVKEIEEMQARVLVQEQLAFEAK
jgi:hypothetical protein